MKKEKYEKILEDYRKQIRRLSKYETKRVIKERKKAKEEMATAMQCIIANCQNIDNDVKNLLIEDIEDLKNKK